MLVRRRQKGGRMGADPLCAYDALQAAWVTREWSVPPEERTAGQSSSTPFFTDDDGEGAWTSATSRRVPKRMAVA
eukprot:2639253-Pleurochrysis_carterae.AAC.1